MLLIWGFVLCLLHLSGASQITSSNVYLSWRSEPNTRGTWTIISNCLITLILCVYSAAHPNVPAPGISHMSKIYSRTKLAVTGILAPEFLLYTAWNQWTAARLLTRRMREINLQKARIQGQVPQEWTMQHSFLMNMGGFVVNVPETCGYTERRCLTLAPGAVVHLTEAGFDFPHVTVAAIQDRSKADGMAKLITCAQAAYMVLQVASRVVERLPVTMLEVNTLGHVLCAFGMFFCWWYKPFNVEDPIVLTGELIDELLPLWILLMHETRDEPWFLLKGLTRLVDRGWRDELPSEITTSIRKVHLKRDATQAGNARGGSQSFLMRIWTFFREPVAEAEEIADTLTQEAGEREWTEQDFVLEWADADLSLTATEAAQKLGELELWSRIVAKFYRSEEKLELSRNFGNDYAERQDLYGKEWLPRYVRLTTSELVLFDLAYQALKKSPNPFRCVVLEIENTTDHLEQYITQKEVPNDQNWPAAATIALTALYGGLHALLWHAHFPTPAEQQLWRASCLLIAVSGLCLVAGTALMVLYKRHESHNESRRPRTESRNSDTDSGSLRRWPRPMQDSNDFTYNPYDSGMELQHPAQAEYYADTQYEPLSDGTGLGVPQVLAQASYYAGPQSELFNGAGLGIPQYPGPAQCYNDSGNPYHPDQEPRDLPATQHHGSSEYQQYVHVSRRRSSSSYRRAHAGQLARRGIEIYNSQRLGGHVANYDNVFDAFQSINDNASSDDRHHRFSYRRNPPRHRNWFDSPSRAQRRPLRQAYKKFIRRCILSAVVAAAVVVIGFLYIFILLYVVARVFLIVEAFISLRSLPPEVYITPQWTQWLPHL